MMKQIVLGVAVVASLSACSKGSDPKAVAGEFTSKYDSGNCAGLRDYIVSAQRESMGAVFEQACQAEAQGRQAGAPAQTTQILEATETGDRATVKVRANGSDSNMALVKEGGAWKVDMQASMGAM